MWHSPACMSSRLTTSLDATHVGCFLAPEPTLSHNRHTSAITILSFPPCLALKPLLKSHLFQEVFANQPFLLGYLAPLILSARSPHHGPINSSQLLIPSHGRNRGLISHISYHRPYGQRLPLYFSALLQHALHSSELTADTQDTQEVGWEGQGSTRKKGCDDGS